MHSHVSGVRGGSALDMMASLKSLISGVNPAVRDTDDDSPFETGSSAGTLPSAVSDSAAGGAPSMTPGLMNALFAAQSEESVKSHPSGLASQLFSLLDKDGNGSISKSEFEGALGQNGKASAADDLFAKLDADGDGSVDPNELAKALQAKGHHGHHRIGAASGGGVNASGGAAGRLDDLLGTPKGGQAVTNSDGSTTTTLSYADGSTISMTTPAPAAAGSGPGGFLARMIQQQAQMFASSPGQSLAVMV